MTAEERERQLEDALVGAMVRLHMHVAHCGTNFENECLRLLGEEPPFGVGYGSIWREVQLRRRQHGI